MSCLGFFPLLTRLLLGSTTNAGAVLLVLACFIRTSGTSPDSGFYSCFLTLLCSYIPRLACRLLLLAIYIYLQIYNPHLTHLMQSLLLPPDSPDQSGFPKGKIWCQLKTANRAAAPQLSGLGDRELVHLRLVTMGIFNVILAVYAARFHEV